MARLPASVILDMAVGPATGSVNTTEAGIVK
jgi:hypothetical protein